MGPLVGLTSIFTHHCPRLVYQINLKPDKIFDVCRAVNGNWNHGEQVGEGLAALAVVDKGRLRLLPRVDLIFKVIHRVVIAVFPFLATLNQSIRSLEKPTILAQNLVFSVSSEPLKCRTAVDDGIVEFGDIGDDERTREIYGSNVDLGVWTVGNSVLRAPSAWCATADRHLEEFHQIC